jgi:hypothetical protein
LAPPTVVDGGADEGLDAGHVELAHPDAGGDEESVAADLAAVVEGDDAVRVLDPQTGDRLGGEDLGAEALGLGGRPPRQVGAADALGEAEVVLDAGAGAGLAAGRLLLDDHRAQAFGGAVDGGAEPGWTGADDDEVVKRLRRGRVQADLLGE